MDSKPIWLCQWVTCLSRQLYWWTLAESKVEYCMQKHGRFDMCLIFAVDCMLLKFCLFVPGTMCIGGRLAKTGVNSATVSRLAIPVYNLQMSHGTRHTNSAGYWAKCSSVPVLGLQVDIWTCSPVFIHQYGHIDKLCH